MEEKKYEGIVQITSAEYRELVTEATENKLKYGNAIIEKWNLERQISELKKELETKINDLDEARRYNALISEHNAISRSLYQSEPLTNKCTPVKKEEPYNG